LGDQGAVKKLWKDNTRCHSLSGHWKASVCAKGCLNTAFLARWDPPVSHIRELSGLGLTFRRSPLAQDRGGDGSGANSVWMN
jgi:hypothetical protein